MYASRPSRIALGLLMGVAVWSHFSRPGRAFKLQLHAEFGMAAGVEGAGWTGQVRPDRRVIEGHCGRVVLLARAVVRYLKMTSLCVQVPRDTIFCDYLAWMHGLRQKSYWIARGHIEAIWRCVLSTIHRCSVIAARRTFFLAI